MKSIIQESVEIVHFGVKIHNPSATPALTGAAGRNRDHAEAAVAPTRACEGRLEENRANT
jgi:hypothetical protein